MFEIPNDNSPFPPLSALTSHPTHFSDPVTTSKDAPSQLPKRTSQAMTSLLSLWTHATLCFVILGTSFP